MAAAFRADPELVRGPRHARPGVAHLHLGAAALAADVEVNVAHGRGFYCSTLTRVHRDAVADNICTHLRAITSVKRPSERVCEECVKTGAEWVHLRTCQTCGTTRCCDDSPNKHASRHARESGHPVIASAESGERWLYCFVDDEVIEY